MFLIDLHKSGCVTGWGYYCTVEDRGGDIVHVTAVYQDAEEAEVRAGEWIVARDEQLATASLRTA